VKQSGINAIVAVVFFLWSTAGLAAAPPLQTQQFVGSFGCKSSYCHGGAGEHNGQNRTWVQQDYHTRAYAILVSARSTRMVEALANARSAQGADVSDLSNGATASTSCTVCHSPLHAAVTSGSASLTNKADLDNGVSCENCHGAAGKWLRSHTRRDWTYPMRVGAGMHDLRNFYVRANTCVACHQNIDPELRAAGHPLLTFELDRQSREEPPHWKDEDPLNGPRLWLVGQAVALREVSWKLTQSTATDPELAAQWNALMWLLGAAGRSELARPVENPDVALAASAQQQADSIARQASGARWDRARAASLLQTLVAIKPELDNSTTVSSDQSYQRALRLVLALDCLARASYRQAYPTGAAAALRVLWEDVRNSANFDHGKFAADLVTFGGTMKAVPY